MVVDVSSLDLGRVSGEILTGPALDAHNTFTAPNRVVPQVFDAATLRDGQLSLTVPAHSVVVLALR